MAVTSWQTFNSVTAETYTDSQGNNKTWEDNSGNGNNAVFLKSAISTLDYPVTIAGTNNTFITTTGKSGERSAYLTLSGLSNLAIPSDATIVGVELMVNRSAPRSTFDVGGGGAGPFYYSVYGTDFDVRLAVNGITSSNVSSANNWIYPIAENGVTTRVDYLGSSSSLFGLTVTPADAGNLVVTYAGTATPTGASDDFPIALLYIDYFAARYHYTTGGTTPPPAATSSVTTSIF